MSGAQQSLDGVSDRGNGPARAASAPSDRHGSGQSITFDNPDCSPGKTRNAPARDALYANNNMPTSLIPASKLAIGMRVVRMERCYRCERETSHVLTLIEICPRTWEQQCCRCEQQRDERGS